MLICGGSIEASEGTGSIVELDATGSIEELDATGSIEASEGTGLIGESDGTGSIEEAEGTGSEEAEGSEEPFGSLAGREFSSGVGSSVGMLLSRFRSGSDPTIDTVETAGSDRESVTETGEGVEGTLSGEV